MPTYTEAEVKKALEEITSKVLNHPQVNGTDYGTNDATHALEIRVYTKTKITHQDLGITSTINQIPIRIINEGPIELH